MAITPLPVPVPQRSDPTNFPARADAFMSALPLFGAEATALQVDVNNKQVLTTASRDAARYSELNAAASSAAAIAAANAVPWVSGTTYQQNSSVISQIDFRTYRRKSTGSGSTDPALDSVNYVLVSNGALQAIKVSQRLATGTTGGPPAATATVTVTRVLNTTDYNDIPGASLSGNTIIIPAGTYEISATAPFGSASRQMLYLYNVTDSAVTLTGASRNGQQVTQEEGTVSGRFTINAQKTFELRQYLVSVSSLDFPTYGGATNLSGFVETYSQLTITKIK